jgi:predicted methyltransferase
MIRHVDKISVAFAALALASTACGSAPAPEAPTAPLTDPPAATPGDATPPAGGEPAAPALSAEDAKKQEEAEKLQKELAEAEKAGALEKTRLGTDEMKKNAAALSGGVYGSTAAALQAAMKSPHRQSGHPDRDAFRHPAETLQFFGLRQNQTVLEIGPGEGWYTELLAPTLAKSGKLYVTNGDPTGPRTERSTFYAIRTKLFLDASPELYGKVEPVLAKAPEVDLGLDGKIDLVLLIRGMHGMANRGHLEPWLAEIHDALKPGATLGIVQHRAAEGADPKVTGKQGYLPEKWVIEQVTAAGFKLAGKSEINANPKDTRDHPEGVWSLPPTLREGDKNRDKYVGIGESDRMTLKFTKVQKPAK